MRRDGTTTGPLAQQPEQWKKGVIAVDPSGGDGPDNDECGIVGMCRGYDDLGYTVGDWSGRLAPEAWGRLAVIKAIDTGFMRVCAEKNFGDAMVASTVAAAKEALVREGIQEAGMVAYSPVHASLGKRQRAEPVASICGEPNNEASWLRGRLRFTVDLSKLEDELTGWVPDVTKTSPNRLDAFVWAATDLFPDLLGSGPPKRPTPTARRRRGSVYG
jgi:phage terminase large subunit-like protein